MTRAFLLLTAVCSVNGSAAGAPVFLIGVDGASWNVLGPLMAQGKMPNLSRLAARGARGPLRSIEPMESPALWTTVATGVSRAEHGITGFVAGGKDLTSLDRTAPALWEILGASSRTVCVVGYLKTWPAEPVNGVMISERVFYSLKRSDLAYPADVLGSLQPLRAWDENSLEAARRMRRFLPFDWDPDFESRAHDTESYRRDRLVDSRLSWVYMRDESYVRAAEKLLARHRPDFFAIHLWGVDFVSHGFWKYMDRKSAGVSASERKDFEKAIPLYYEYVDEAIGRLLAAAGGDADVFVVSDHGFQAWTPPPGDLNHMLSGNHALEGVLIAAGPDISRGGSAPSASLLDLAPTILYLSGAPIAKTLEGKVLEGLLSARAKGRSSFVVDRYPARAAAPPRPAGAALDPKMREMLRASGYLQ